MNLIDLSYPVSNNMATYPTDPDVTIRMEKNIKTHHSLLHSFTMGTHTGTHLDAPAHVIKNGKTLDEIDLNHFIGRAIIVDKDSYYKLENFDENIDGVIFNTGWYNQGFYDSQTLNYFLIHFHLIYHFLLLQLHCPKILL